MPVALSAAKKRAAKSMRIGSWGAVLRRMVGKVREKGTPEQRSEDREGPAMQVSGAELRADAQAPSREHAWGFSGAQPASGVEGGERRPGSRSWGHGKNMAIYSSRDEKPLKY